MGIFKLEGIGYLVIEAVEDENIELLIGIECFIVGFVIFYSFVNRIVDTILDPRLRRA
jgi:ABC-type dipeptide/oligopeptide/nickel transport system permease component